MPLWGLFFVSLVGVFFFLTWLPTLLTGAGHSPDQVVSIIFAYQGGGLIGALVLARLVTVARPFLAIGAGYLLSGAAILLIGGLGARPVLAGKGQWLSDRLPQAPKQAA